MGLVPDAVLDEIRSRIDIVELVSEYVSLKRTGARYVGLCPFHDDHRPSLTVNPKLQIFKCFACGAGGDCFGFVMRRLGLSFPEAVATLAERVGVELPAGGDGPAEGTGELYELCRQAAVIFEAALWDERGERARRYLASRGVDESVARRWHLGYADGHSLSRSLGGFRRLGPDAGLATRASGGKVVELLRDRLVFPLRDARGRTVAFAGRALGDARPKYLNSPETRIYKKGRLLYGLDIAAEAARAQGRVILVEGYTDHLRVASAGFEAVVATCGTALTEAQARLLRRVASRVYIAFDGDEAGRKAAARAVEVVLAAELEPLVVELPEGADPDSFIAERGAEAFSGALDAARDGLAYRCEVALSGGSGPLSRTKAAREVLAGIAAVRSAAARAELLSRAAVHLGLPPEVLAAELAGLTGRRQEEGGGERTEGPPAYERVLLRAMFTHPELAQELRGVLSPEDFTGRAAELVDAVLTDPAGARSRILDGGDEALIGLLAHICAEEGGMDEGTHGEVDEAVIIKDCLARLSEARARREREALLAELANAEKKGEDTTEILRRLQAIARSPLGSI